jgi:hypothetical protein
MANFVLSWNLTFCFSEGKSLPAASKLHCEMVPTVSVIVID